MRISITTSLALIASAAAALLAGCGVGQPYAAATSTSRTGVSQSEFVSDSTRYNIIYSFQGPSDTDLPHSKLAMVDGTFFGTAYGGGSCYNGPCGSIFKITPSGTEHVIYEFKGGSDGSDPVGDLLNVKGVLYGVTLSGGVTTGNCAPNGCGIVFKVTTTGNEQVLYRFKGGKDANFPLAGLTWQNGMLYGTSAHGGGYYGLGTVFQVDLKGHEKVIYRFKGGAIDGSSPQAPLLSFHGTLYGTTAYDGCYQCEGGNGIVFSVTPQGQERLLYAFLGADNGGDGGVPEAGLVAVNNVFYGTTVAGGYDKSSQCGRSSGHNLRGCGTVFSITPSGEEHVLHRFRGPDGNSPDVTLAALNGKLYGTTFTGGDSTAYFSGHGTAFQVTVRGKQKVLHRFTAAPDGDEPVASLTAFDGKLYGTTLYGGTSCSGASPPGCGTVFELKP